MQIVIRQTGNSAAILLPKPVMAHLCVDVGDKLDLDLQEGKIILSPVPRHPRAGWAKAARALADAGADRLEWPEFNDTGDKDREW